MVAAKDNFLGKYIYKDTLARNLAAVIYRVSILSSPSFYGCVVWWIGSHSESLAGGVSPDSQ